MFKKIEYPSFDNNNKEKKVINRINCLCGENFGEKELKKHIRKCTLFLYRFKIFDYKISKLLEEYLSDKKNLFLVRFLFKRYLKLLDKKIKKYLKEKEIEDLIKIQNTNNNEEKESSSSEKSEEDFLLQQKNKLRKYNIDYLIKSNKKNQININEINEINENEINENKINENEIFNEKEKNKTMNIKIKQKKEETKIHSPERRSNSKKFFNFINLFTFRKKNKCQFCGSEMDEDNNCLNEKCRELNIIKCRKKLHCGHTCLGVENEIICPPCLDNKCKQYGGLFNQTKKTCCQICREKLSSSPIVILSCNHYVHYFCILKQLKNGENLYGKKLNFDFMKCPVCDSIFECNSIPEIQKKIDKYKEIYIKVRKMISLRLKYEKIDSTQNPFDFFIFFLCYKCHNPYYAGLNNNKNININRINDDSNVSGNKEDCLCGKHSFINNAKGQTICTKHEDIFIEYKCKYCCKIASRFWSQTHFCEECYSKKNYFNNNYCEIKECDIDTCPFNGFHAPNGVEYCLGCFICRLENIQHEYPIFVDS